VSPGTKWLYPYENGSNYTQFAGSGDTVKVLPKFYIEVTGYPNAFMSGIADTATINISSDSANVSSGETVQLIVRDDSGHISAGTVTLIANAAGHYISTGVTLNYDGSTSVSGEVPIKIFACSNKELTVDQNTGHPYVYVFDNINVNVGYPNAFIEGESDQTTATIGTNVNGGTNGRWATVFLWSNLSSEISAATSEVILKNNGPGNMTVSGPTPVLRYLSSATVAPRRVQIELYNKDTRSSSKFATSGHDYLYILEQETGSFVVTVTDPTSFLSGAVTVDIADIFHTFTGTSSGDTIDVTVGICDGTPVTASTTHVTLYVPTDGATPVPLTLVR